MRGFKSIFVSSKHKIKRFLTQEKYFQTTNAVDTLPLTRDLMGGGGGGAKAPMWFFANNSNSVRISALNFQYLSGYQFYVSSKKNLPKITQSQQL